MGALSGHHLLSLHQARNQGGEPPPRKLWT